MKPKIVTGFDGFSDAGFETKASSIYASMNGNANFPAPTPDMTTINSAVQAYTAALIAAQTRERNAVAIKNQARETLTDLLIQLASYVSMAANFDKTALVSSGFDLASEGDSAPIDSPKNIQLSDGPNSGNLVVKVNAVKGAKSYVHQYTSDPLTASSTWSQIITTTSRYTFTNLSTAKRYWCRVGAVGPFNQLVFSDAISRIVQ